MKPDPADVAFGAARARAVAAHPFAGKHIRGEAGRPDAILGVRCKICGTDIVRLLPTNRVVEMNGEPLRVGVLMALPAYRDITIEFDDGSAHHTSACDTCASEPSLAELETMYAGDLAQWVTEERVLGAAIRWDRVARRQITGFRKGFR